MADCHKIVCFLEYNKNVEKEGELSTQEQTILRQSVLDCPIKVSFLGCDNKKKKKGFFEQLTYCDLIFIPHQSIQLTKGSIYDIPNNKKKIKCLIILTKRSKI